MRPEFRRQGGVVVPSHQLRHAPADQGGEGGVDVAEVLVLHHEEARLELLKQHAGRAAVIERVGKEWRGHGRTGWRGSTVVGPLTR